MAPTLIPGDRVLVLRGLGPFRPALRVGDLVALADPRLRPCRWRRGVPRQRLMIKRVVGLGGGRVRVQGDNAAASTDSRHFGPLTSGDLRGRVVYRYHPEGRRGRLS